MKILHIAPIGHHSEGIGSVLRKLYPIQVGLGNDVRIITVYENKIYSGWPIESIKSKTEFLDYICKWLPDIVIFHSHFHIEYIRFAKILKKMNVPYCVQLHGALSKSNYKKNHFKKYIAGLLFFNSVLKGADRIIYLNKAEYDNSIVPRLNPHYAIIPNGCDLPNDLAISRPENKPIEIVFIGRIRTNHKGLDILIPAIRKVEKECNNRIHFSFYGNEDDVDIDYLKEELQTVGIANYCGSAYGEQKEIILRNADLFILTSRYEGMPMGVLEAWSYGVPCILTEGTNMTGKDISKDAYWKCELSSDDICRTVILAVDQYIKDPLLYRMAAVQEAKKYDWATIASNSIRTFNAILHNMANNGK